MRLECEYRMRR